MRNLPFAVRMLMRDARSGELTILALAVIVAVAALTAVGFFTDRVNQAVKAQAAEVLAADLRLQSSRPIGTQYFEEAARRGIRVVYASSSSVYGDAETYPTPEDVRPRPISPNGSRSATLSAARTARSRSRWWVAILAPPRSA